LFANLGYHPQYDFEMDIRVETPEEREAQTAAERLEKIIHDVARTEMRYAQTRQVDGADIHRTPAPAFQPGGVVWVVDGTGVQCDQAVSWKTNIMGPTALSEP
jgi:hypothetical protein